MNLTSMPMTQPAAASTSLISLYVGLSTACKKKRGHCTVEIFVDMQCLEWRQLVREEFHTINRLHLTPEMHSREMWYFKWNNVDIEPLCKLTVTNTVQTIKFQRLKITRPAVFFFVPKAPTLWQLSTAKKPRFSLKGRFYSLGIIVWKLYFWG